MKGVSMNKVRTFILLICPIMCFGFAQNQTPPKEWKGKIEEKNGVIFVSNPKTPIYKRPVCRLDLELSIGEAEGREEYMFELIGGIAVDQDENIYVSDWKTSEIKVFDKKGDYIRTFGRKGQGPGEFERITNMQIINQDDLLVYDGNTKRLSYFSLDGHFKRSISMNKLSALHLAINSTSGVITSSYQLDPETAMISTAVNLFDSDLNLIKTLDKSKPTDVLTPFQPFLVYKLKKNDDIVIGHNSKYELKVYNPQGKLIRIITKDYDPVRISADEKRERLEKLEQPLNKDVPNFYPAFNRIIVDDKNRMLIQTYEKTDDGKGFIYHVFDQEGKYLADLEINNSPQILSENTLYSVEEDEDGYQYVRRYKVIWNYE